MLLVPEEPPIRVILIIRSRLLTLTVGVDNCHRVTIAPDSLSIKVTN